MSCGTGNVLVDFGSVPGQDRITVAIARASVTAAAYVEAYLFPQTTADKSVDDQIVDSVKCYAHSVVAGVGFSITVQAIDGLLLGIYSVNWVSTE